MKQWNFKNKWYRLNSMVACADCFFFLATPLGDRIQAASFLRFQASMAIDCHCLQAVVAIVLHQACVAEIFSSKSSWLFGFPRMAIRRLSRILYPGSTARLNKWEVKLKWLLAMANGAATGPAGTIIGIVELPENVTLKWENNATSVQLGRLYSVWCILFVVLSNVYSIYLHQFFFQPQQFHPRIWNDQLYTNVWESTWEWSDGTWWRKCVFQSGWEYWCLGYAKETRIHACG